MDKKENVVDVIKSCDDRIEEIIQNAIYEIFPMTKVECKYTSTLKILLIRVRYFCYGEGLEISIRYTDKACDIIGCGDFLDIIVDEVGNKIGQKIAMKNNERRNENDEI